jgi:hypothetical protein
MEEEKLPTDKESILGAAALAGALGVQLTGELTAAAIFALVAAYSATLPNDLGKTVKEGGKKAAQAYEKGKELNEQYEVVTKAKKATDAVVSVADNLNKNYGITAKIDERLKLTDGYEDLKSSVGSKVDELKASVDDLKSKASEKQ